MQFGDRESWIGHDSCYNKGLGKRFVTDMREREREREREKEGSKEGGDG
jgi:hypothetical protein